MIALALLLATLAPDETLADQIARCGIARDQIAVRYEAGLQDDTATIATPDAALTSDQLACIVGLAISGRFVAFTDPAAQARFDPLVQASERAAATSEARQWLSEHGLLDRLPVYDPTRQTLAEFAGSLEALCGAAPGTLLSAGHGKLLQILPPPGLDMDDAQSTRFQCGISAAIAANTDPEAYSVGFIGNEQMATPQPNP